MRSLAHWLFIVMLLFVSQAARAQSGLPASVIDAHSRPAVYSLPVNDALLLDRDYRRIEGPFSIYDAPDGAEIQSLTDGYTFVTVQEENGGWARIGDGQWVKTEVLSATTMPSRFADALLAGR